MDPLSVGASVIAVVGATGKVIKEIRRLKALHDTPRELDDLLAEISQFELVLQAVQKAYENPRSELGRLLETAQRILVDFQSLIEYRLTEAGTSNKVDRWQWTRSSKDVERLRGQLRDVTANLVALVGVNTSATLHQVSQVTNEVLSEHRQFSNQILPMFAHLVQLLEDSPSTRAALTGSLGNVRQLTLESAPQANDTVANITESKTLQPDQTAPKLHPQSTLRVSKIQKISICDRDCTCKCHIWRQFGGRGIFSKIIGRGYIKTAGFSMIGTRCDIESCEAHAAPRVSVEYRMPQWLASRMILIWFTSAPPCSPELVLRVPRVIERGLQVFYDSLDDIESFKVAITNGDLKPDDVDDNYGFNLLTVAVIRMNWETLFYLSSYGDFCNPSYITPWAETMIWGHLALDPSNPIAYYPDRQNTLLTELFPLVEWECHVEREAFTTLHQIVCGLSGLSLDVELQDSTAIDQLDRNGRSALWYAVTHRRLDYVRRLLEQGADPNIGDPPIRAAAARSGHYAITEVLLEKGATISPSSEDGWLPWPCDSFDRDSLAIDELFIRHGIDLNHRAEWRGVEDTTILMRLSLDSVGSVAPLRLKQLIQFGADIEVTDKKGRTAIMCTAQASFSEAFDILARAGARLDRETVTGSTILHLAIAYTVTYHWKKWVYGLCEAMRKADLTKLDLDAKDGDGNRAYDVLRIRNGPNWDGYCQSKGIWTYWRASHQEEELEDELEAIRAFEKLLRHIQESQGVPEADQYPPLGEYLSRDIEEEAVPGAWPAY